MEVVESESDHADLSASVSPTAGKVAYGLPVPIEDQLGVWIPASVGLIRAPVLRLTFNAKRYTIPR